MTISTATIRARGLHFGEGPRWHDGALYFSDMHARKVCRWREGEAVETVATFPGPVSGLGWQPDGTLLVVSMLEKQVLRSDGAGGFAVHADLSALVPERCNDMVVDAAGGAYVGNFGFDLHGGGAPASTVLCYIPPEGGRAVVAAEDVAFPNGTVITPDGNTLILGESLGRRLTAFTIAAPGVLTERRVFAEFPEGRLPDGICLDTAGGVWAASPTGDECLRLEAGGEVTHRVTVSQGAYACMLGGPGEQTLYVLTAADSDPAAPAGTGCIEAAPAPYPRAGLP
jgi:sugar lactone lactonase YvrE